MIGGLGHICQQGGVAIRIAGYEAANLRSFGERGHRCEQCPALEVVPLRITVKWEKVIPVENSVDTHVLSALHCRNIVLVAHMLRMQLDAYANLVRSARWFQEFVAFL